MNHTSDTPLSGRGRILLIRGGAIGDFILTLPVLAALRAHFPGVRLEVLGYRHIAELAQAGGLADEVRSIEARSLAGFFARDGVLAPDLQEYFDRFAIILSYLYDPDGVFEANVRRCTKGQFIVGPHRPDERHARHATKVFLEPLERLAIFDADPVPKLTLASRPGPVASEKAPMPRVLALHPGSGSERKNWPEDHWAQLLDGLNSMSSQHLLLVGGEAEGDRLRRLAGRVAPGRLDCAFHLPLTGLAARLARCSAFVGHDSGISHLAAALGLNVLVLWADSAEAVWRPRGPRVRILQAPGGVTKLPVAKVLKALETLLP